MTSDSSPLQVLLKYKKMGLVDNGGICKCQFR